MADIFSQTVPRDTYKFSNEVSQPGSSSPAASNPTATPQDGDDSNSNEASGLSGGAIAGIVVGVVVGIVAILGGILAWLRRSKSRNAIVQNMPTETTETTGMVFPKSELDANNTRHELGDQSWAHEVGGREMQKVISQHPRPAELPDSHLVELR